MDAQGERRTMLMGAAIGVCGAGVVALLCVLLWNPKGREAKEPPRERYVSTPSALSGAPIRYPSPSAPTAAPFAPPVAPVRREWTEGEKRAQALEALRGEVQAAHAFSFFGAEPDKREKGKTVQSPAASGEGSGEQEPVASAPPVGGGDGSQKERPQVSGPTEPEPGREVAVAKTPKSEPPAAAPQAPVPPMPQPSSPAASEAPKPTFNSAPPPTRPRSPF